MPNKKISELPFLESTGYTSTDVVPLVTYFSAVTGTTVQTNIIDFQNYIINNGYWTSGSTGANSIIANNGTGNDATNDYAIAVGEQTTSSGLGSFAEGILTQANGNYSHAEGNASIAQGDYSHAEGQGTTTNGFSSHAEGRATTADGNYSHAEGNNTQAIGNNSHSEGRLTIAGGDSSHAQGDYTNASGNFSHASGVGLSGNEILARGQTSFIHCEVTVPGASAVYSDNSSILGGIDNFISGSSNNTSIIGGKGNYIGTGATGSSVIGGLGNIVNDSVLNTTILGSTGITATNSNTVYVPNFVIYTEYEPTSSADTAGEPGSVTWSSNSDSLYYKTANGWFILSGVTF